MPYYFRVKNVIDSNHLVFTKLCTANKTRNVPQHLALTTPNASAIEPSTCFQLLPASPFPRS